MRKESMFGELASRLSGQPENVATEALLYLLKRHDGIWLGLRAYFANNGIQAPDKAVFRTQTTSKADTSIPDLSIAGLNGVQSVLIEAKFWAGLTENQPVTYLKRLPTGQIAALVVIAPTQRFETLWYKLAEKCSDAGLVLDPPVLPSQNFRRAEVTGTRHSLALTS